MQNLKLLFFWCLLPLLLACTGWYLHVATGQAAAQEARLRELGAELAELARTAPEQNVRYGGGTMSARSAAVVAAEALRGAQLSNRYLGQQAWVARLALLSGIVALVLGLYTLWHCWRTGRAALASRERFVEVVESVRRRMTLHMVAYSLALAVSASMVAVYAALWGLTRSDGGMIALLVVSPVAWAVYALIRALIKLLWRPPHAHGQPVELLGRELSRTAAPGLWQWVDAVGRKLDALVPERIVVGLDDGFFVTSCPVRLLPEGTVLQGRTLYLPLAFCSVMSQDEVSAIVGHELAHFTGGDTEYSLRLQPFRASMAGSIESFLVEDEADEVHFLKAPALALAVFMAGQLEAAARHWERERELVADAVSCKVVDARTSACALLRVVALTAMIDQHMSRAHRQATDDVVATLVRHIETTGISLPAPELEPTLPHPTDTHPPIRQRIAAMGIGLAPDLLADAMRVPSAHDTTWFQGLLLAK